MPTEGENYSVWRCWSTAESYKLFPVSSSPASSLGENGEPTARRSWRSLVKLFIQMVVFKPAWSTQDLSLLPFLATKQKSMATGWCSKQISFMAIYEWLVKSPVPLSAFEPDLQFCHSGLKASAVWRVFTTYSPFIFQGEVLMSPSLDRSTPALFFSPTLWIQSRNGSAHCDIDAPGASANGDALLWAGQ